LNVETYIKYIRELNQKMKSINCNRVALFYDGLSTHKAKDALRLIADELGWICLLNVAFQPRLNPVERLFGLIKKEWKKQLLNLLVNGQ